MHLIIALSRTDDVKSVGLLRLQHLFYFFTPYWANQHVSISPSLHPIRITAQSSPEQNSLRHIPETSTLPKASHTKMKPQSGSTGLSQLFCTSVVRASLSLFFFITFSGVMMEWLLWQKYHKNKSISISLLRKDKLKNLLSLDQCKIKNCHLYTENSSMGHFFFTVIYMPVRFMPTTSELFML